MGMCVKTDITGESINEGGWDGLTCRILMNCAFIAGTYLLGGHNVTDVLHNCCFKTI